MGYWSTNVEEKNVSWIQQLYPYALLASQTFFQRRFRWSWSEDVVDYKEVQWDFLGQLVLHFGET
jgi:hypothetical protein